MKYNISPSTGMVRIQVDNALMAPGSGPPRIRRLGGKAVHLGHNYGSDSWCTGTQSSVTSGTVFAPDYWCPKCVALCLRICGKEPPPPVIPCEFFGDRP